MMLISPSQLHNKYPFLQVNYLTDTLNFTPKEKVLILKLHISQINISNHIQSIEIEGTVSDSQDFLFDFSHKRLTLHWKKYDKALYKEFQNFGEDIVHIFKTFQKKIATP